MERERCHLVCLYKSQHQDEDTRSIRLLLDDQFKYTGNATLQPADVGAVLVDLSKDLLNGTIRIIYEYDLDDDHVDIMQLNGCLDVNCTEHAFTVPQKSASCSTMYSLLYIVLLVISYSFIS